MSARLVCAGRIPSALDIHPRRNGKRSRKRRENAQKNLSKLLRASRVIVVVAIFSMLIGCATESPISEDRWRWEKEYEQQAARDAGRIGYIGNAGPTAFTH